MNLIDYVMGDLSEKGKMKMKYTLIEDLIKDLEKLDKREFDDMQDKIEHFKDLLEDYLIWADEDIAYYNEEKPSEDVDRIIDEQRLKEFFGD